MLEPFTESILGLSRCHIQGMQPSQGTHHGGAAAWQHLVNTVDTVERPGQTLHKGATSIQLTSSRAPVLCRSAAVLLHGSIHSPHVCLCCCCCSTQHNWCCHAPVPPGNHRLRSGLHILTRACHVTFCGTSGSQHKR